MLAAGRCAAPKKEISGSFSEFMALSQVALARIAEGIALPIFLLYMTLRPPAVQADWLGPYLGGAIVAVLGCWLVWRQKLVLNRIQLGLALYFVTGAAGLLAGWQPLNFFYGRAEATAMLYWILMVGVVATAITPSGFVGVAGLPRKTVVSASLGLLALLLAAIVLSWRFHTQPALAAYAPFLALFAAHGIVRARLTALTTKAA
jgi:hypothetical protein